MSTFRERVAAIMAERVKQGHPEDVDSVAYTWTDGKQRYLSIFYESESDEHTEISITLPDA